MNIFTCIYMNVYFHFSWVNIQEQNNLYQYCWLRTTIIQCFSYVCGSTVQVCGSQPIKSVCCWLNLWCLDIVCFIWVALQVVCSTWSPSPANQSRFLSIIQAGNHIFLAKNSPKTKAESGWSRAAKSLCKMCGHMDGQKIGAVFCQSISSETNMPTIFQYLM